MGHETMSFSGLELPVLGEVDVVVAGGSCTGVFAGISAARGGCSVAIVENQNRFGGTATAGQVCYWHSLKDSRYESQIIGGLTQEVLDRMWKRRVVEFRDKSPDVYANLNTEELSIELDEMALEAGLEVHFHSRVVGVVREGRRLHGVIVGNKDGLGIFKASYFIDCTGDGDLVKFSGEALWSNEELQPSTTCGKFSRWLCGEKAPVSILSLVHEHAEEYQMPEGVMWGGYGVGTKTYMLAGTNVPTLDVSVAANLTAAEIEGRRQLRAIADIVAASGYERPILEAVPSLIGVRDSRHIHSLYQVTQDDLLSGRRFPDEAGCGTYRIDVHQRNPPGTRFLYLDGTECFWGPGVPIKKTHWRDPSLPTPPCYTWPLRSQIPVGFDNLITAGRMIDADRGAFGALRVMVNMNQCGESAGRAVAAAKKTGQTLPDWLHGAFGV